MNNDHEKRGSSYVVLYLRNLHCGVLLSRLTEAACAVIKLSMHSVDIYITEKHLYVVLQRTLINVYFRIFDRTPFEKIILWTMVIY